MFPLVAMTLIVAAPTLVRGNPIQPKPDLGLRREIDRYIDARYLPREKAEASTKAMADKLRDAKLSMKDVEHLLRSGRATYRDDFTTKTRGIVIYQNRVLCDHVDYETSFLLFVPSSYDRTKPAPIVLVGHGGNSAMTRDNAKDAAIAGLTPLLKEAEKHGTILAAPLSERGWGWIGDSVILSTLSFLQRFLNIDPDRVYVTGHSMGGHLSYRSGIFMPDRWGAVAPMSGGYDYVENKQIHNLVNVPGYATYGTKEPFDINPFNNKMKAWAKEHRYDWVFAEKAGGHTIFDDEIPKVFQFFKDHPRNLYRSAVYFRIQGRLAHDRAETNPKWNVKHEWKPGRSIDRSTVHWLKLMPLEDEKVTQVVRAEIAGPNRIEITASNARMVRLYLHPRMVDLEKPVTVFVNGKKVHDKKVTPSLETMLELCRDYDDRGRVFHAAIDVAIDDSRDVPEPRGTEKARKS